MAEIFSEEWWHHGSVGIAQQKCSISAIGDSALLFINERKGIAIGHIDNRTTTVLSGGLANVVGWTVPMTFKLDTAAKRVDFSNNDFWTHQ